MSKAIGGYIRRGDRRHVPPGPDDGIPRCPSCQARLDTELIRHICKEVTYQTTVTPAATIPLMPPGDRRGARWTR